MKLLVFGDNSQLGRELIRLLSSSEIEFETLNSTEVDVLKPKDVVKAVSRINPTQLINVSTYSNLQKAELDSDAARQCDLVNTEGVAGLARVCEQLSIPIIHHSSSYVFDGQKKETYKEEDESNPVGRYGKSKWYAERTLREETAKHIILRTDWLFSSYRDNYFRNLIADCKKQKGKVSVIDNRFSPTYANDAARVILAIVKQVNCNAEVWGTYHYNSMQPVNQDQFVLHVLEDAAKLDPVLEKLISSLKVELQPVELPYIRNSALNCEKIMATFGIKQRSRAAGVTEVLEAIYGILKSDQSDSASVAPKKKAKTKAKARTKQKAKQKTKQKAQQKKETVKEGTVRKEKARRKKIPVKSPSKGSPPAKKAAKRKSSPSP